MFASCGRRKVYRSLTEERKNVMTTSQPNRVTSAAASGLRNWVSAIRDEVRDIRIIQRPIALIVKSVMERPFLGPLQVPSELLLKQEPFQLGIDMRSHFSKDVKPANTTISLKPLKRNLFPTQSDLSDYPGVQRLYFLIRTY